MGRAARYSDQDILDAALALAAEGGARAATAVAIAQRLGAPSGSIYHRFASRDLILATLWVRTVRRFQQGFLAGLSSVDNREAVRQAVTHTLDWTAAHPREATILVLYRREDLLARWPDELGDELRTLNDEVKRAVEDFVVRCHGSAEATALGKARFALIELPHAAVRQTIGGGGAPAWLTDTVVSAALTVLDLAEDESRERSG